MSENYNNSYYNSEDLDEHMNDFDATTESQSAPPAIPLTEAEAMAQALSLLTIEPNGLALWDFCQDCTDMGQGWGAYCTKCQAEYVLQSDKSNSWYYASQ